MVSFDWLKNLCVYIWLFDLLWMIIIMGYYVGKYKYNRETLVDIWCVFIGQVCIYINLVKCKCRGKAL